MVTVMVHARVKVEKLEAFLEVASLLTAQAKQNPECVSYAFHQRTDAPAEFVLFEQWKSKQALEGHIDDLPTLLGAPKKGERLPEKLLDMYEAVEPIYYDVVGVELGGTSGLGF